jgi:hypothetical protein
MRADTADVRARLQQIFFPLGSNEELMSLPSFASRRHAPGVNHLEVLK